MFHFDCLKHHQGIPVKGLHRCDNRQRSINFINKMTPFRNLMNWLLVVKGSDPCELSTTMIVCIWNKLYRTTITWQLSCTRVGARTSAVVCVSSSSIRNHQCMAAASPFYLTLHRRALLNSPAKLPDLMLTSSCRFLAQLIQHACYRNEGFKTYAVWLWLFSLEQMLYLRLIFARSQ